MIAVLQERFMDQHELSQALGIREKEVALHLPHIAKTTAGRSIAKRAVMYSRIADA